MPHRTTVIVSQTIYIMAKSKSKQTSAKGRKTKTVIRQIRATGLDAGGAAYARLLADPCNAPLAHPTYSGSEGGYLLRADTFFTPGIAAGATSGIVMYTPGLLTDTNLGLLFADGPASGAFQTVVAGATSAIPGHVFLNANASAARCVAACMKVSFPGSESARSGRVHYGQVTSGIIALGGNYKPDDLAATVPHFQRTPADVIEIIWKPNDADQLFSRPNTPNANDSAKNNKAASLLFCFAGLPATTGMVVHMTAVYEWQPAQALGLAVPNLSKSPSRNTLDEVVNYLISKGFGFIKSYAMAAGNNALQGLMGEVYGIMGPNAHRRSLMAT